MLDIQKVKNYKEESYQEENLKEKRRLNKTILIFSAAVIILILGWLTASYFSRTSVNKSDWQAVFLTDGQVYFGQVVKEMPDTVILRNIYYLQTRQPLQQLKPGEATSLGRSALPLVKLGNELHAPIDEMRINRQHVLFIEDLKDEGEVVKAIKAYQENNQ